MKKINLAILSLGLCNTSIAEAVEALPPVIDFGSDNKKETKKRKKRQLELARRQKRLDKMKAT